MSTSKREFFTKMTETLSICDKKYIKYIGSHINYNNDFIVMNLCLVFTFSVFFELMLCVPRVVTLVMSINSLRC